MKMDIQCQGKSDNFRWGKIIKSQAIQVADSLNRNWVKMPFRLTSENLNRSHHIYIPLNLFKMYVIIESGLRGEKIILSTLN